MTNQIRVAVVILALAGCGRSGQPIPPPDPMATGGGAAGGGTAAAGGGTAQTGCLDPRIATEGVDPTPSTHLLSCSFTERDEGGPVEDGVRSFDAKGQLLSERFQRLDEPPRTTVHDYTFARAPRKQLQRWQYDAAGRVLHQTIDEGIDELIDDERTWAFDANGHQTLEERRLGDWRTRNVSTFDAAGWLATDAWFDGDDQTRLVTWTRRPDGAPLTSVIHDQAGVLESTTSWSYDERGVLTRQETIDPMGKLVSRSTYDAMGRVVEVRSGWNATAELLHTTEYDAQGNMVHDRQVDTDGNEVDDLLQTFDANHHRLTEKHTWGHHLVGGPQVDFLELTVGACGETLTSHSTTNGQPRVDTTLTWDEAGHLVTSLSKQQWPSVSTTRTTSTFDSAGHLLTTTNETEVGGQWRTDITRTRSFDAAGHLLLERYDNAATHNGTSEASTFDERGNLTVLDSNANFGHHQVHLTGDYGCF